MRDDRNSEELAEVVAELRAWSGWLRDSGVRWVPTTAPAAAGGAEAPAPQPESGPEPTTEAPRAERRPDRAPAPEVPPARPPEPPRSAPPEPPRSAPPPRDSGPLGWAKGVDSPALKQIRTELGDCVRCKLSQGRTNLVFGVGNPDAELVFVGEGPGREEDRQGEPFVGAAGELLTKMIQAMGYRREDVYICNVVKCRPPNNRDPEPDEVAACEPFLKAQLAALRPRAVVALGKFAVQTLRGDYATGIMRVRGRWFEYEGVPVMPTFHPAYLLRNPAAKREAWADLQAVMAKLGKQP